MTRRSERETTKEPGRRSGGARWFQLLVRSVLPMSVLQCSSPTSAGEPALLNATVLGGQKFVPMQIGGRVTIEVAVKNSRGELVKPNAPYSFVSRAPDAVAVDKSGIVIALQRSLTWVVTTLPIPGGALSDSVQVEVIAP
jgi:hypothetical protein